MAPAGRVDEDRSGQFHLFRRVLAERLENLRDNALGVESSLFGIPFFYWWQIFGIFLTAASIYPVYLYQESRRK